jgi:hypothetical protein
MRLAWLGAIGATCVCLAGQARAEDAQSTANSQSGYVTVTPHKPVPAAQPRHTKTQASGDKSAQTNDLVTHPRPVPKPPNSSSSFTYGWKASSDQGNGFMGGLRLGF